MAIEQQVFDAFAIAKNESISGIELTLDPTKWSKRMTNIVVRAVNTGIADCGYDTSRFIETLLNTYGLGTERVHRWNANMKTSMIKPEKLEEAKAYVAALIKLRDNTSWEEDYFMRMTDKGEELYKIPIPSNFDAKDKRKFLNDYIKDQDEQEQILRADLIDNIRSGSPLKISYTM
mgnify:CR=1 FL=1